MNYIYSTLTAPNLYTNYVKSNSDLPIVESKVLINGGANVASKNLITPYGVVTSVTDEQLEALQQNDDFKLHVENGFIKISTAKEDADVVAADMNSRDDAAPIVPQDYEGATGAKPAEEFNASAVKATKKKL